MRTLKRSMPHRVARLTRAALLGALSCGFLLASSQPAHALQGGEDPSTLPVLIDKRYGNEGKLQAYLLFSTPLTGKFTESNGGILGVNYNFLDWLGVGLVGGIFATDEISVVADEVRQSGRAPLPDLFRMQWMAGADVTFTPLYGRVSFASEYNPAFDLFVLVGGGLTGVERTVGPVGSTDSVSETTGYANAGFGTRFHFVDFLALRIEYRHILMFEPDIPQGELNINTGPDDAPSTALTNVQQIQLGFQVMF
ncbi:MAG: outer membrane beta-barrel domain-containing protein [Myxococcota bacterium]